MLRTRVVGYLVGVHVVFAAVLLWAVGGAPVWVLAVEAAVAVSLAVGLALAVRVARSLEVGDEAARLLHDGDFTTRLRPTGDARAGRLIEVYNSMADSLRRERSRIREQQHFLEQIIAASPAGVIVLDFGGRVSDVNAAGLRLLERPAEAVVGRTLDEIGTPLASELAALRPGAGDVLGHAGGRRLRVFKGSFVDRGFARTFCLVEELTDEVRQIERAAYEKVIRVMSHEVSNSVAATNSLLESSLAYGPELAARSRQEFEDALRIAMGRSTELNRFIRRFADVFRLPPITREPVDLRGLIDGLLALSRAQAPDVQTGWAAREPTGPFVVPVDRAQFEQACLNILKNATEAAGAGGVVTVSLRATASAGELVVEDSGAGPGPEAAAHLFTPFFSTKPQGQGIGLTLVSEILAAHGFSYSLERQGGGPTRFTIRMPLRPEPVSGR